MRPRTIYMLIILELILFCFSQAAMQRSRRFRKMVGGKDARTEDWEFIALLTFLQPFARWKICSAAVIHRSWLITAAHCVDDIEYYPEYLQINLNSKKTSSDQTTIYGAMKIILHPMHRIIKQLSTATAFSWDYDIALIQLNSSIPNNLKPIFIPAKEININECKAAGWGSKQELKSVSDISKNNYVISETLQEIQVPLVPWIRCHDFRTPSHERFAALNYHVICGGARGMEIEYKKGGCIGDSGSPLVCNSSEGRVLHGIMLGGNPLCSQGIDFMIFTKVMHFKFWIDRIIALYTKKDP